METRLLGVSPGECRRGDHPRTWRRDTDTQLAGFAAGATTPDYRNTHDLLGALQFGFPPLGNDPP